MDGPGRTSSDILGIEVGRRTVRGVRLDQETTELTAAAECAFDPVAIGVDGIIDPSVVGSALDVLIHRLGVQDRSAVRVGMTIGPRNAGVGSGPAMAGWLEAQAANLQEPMTCSGGLGIAFVPSRSIDAAVKLAHGCGLDLVRIDLAPVAGARAIGDQVEDVICMGSGRGWQARMRDFEVLEAMENVEIDLDAPLAIVGSDNASRSIARYGWVEIGAELDQAQRLEIGQLAPAVGAAIGVAYESPANLLLGREVVCASVRPPPALAVVRDPVPEPKAATGQSAVGAVLAGAVGGPTAADEDVDLNPDLSMDHLANYELVGNGAEATLQLTKIEVDDGQRAMRPQHQAKVDPNRKPPVERAKRATPPQVDRVAPPQAEQALPPQVERAAATAGVAPGRGAPPAHAGVRVPAPEKRSAPGAATRSAQGDLWGDSVDESDPITMFSPDTEVRHMMGKRESRVGPDVLFVVLLISAIALLLAYLYV